MLQGPKDQPCVAAALFGGQRVLPLAAGPTSTTTYSCDARTLPKTRVWGSESENVHCSSATAPLKIELRWGCEESSEKTAVGSGVSFKYDPFGRRIYKSSTSGTSIFAYSGDDLIEEVNATGGLVARYSQGPEIDEPLALLRSGATSYYEADGLGTVTSLSNAAGALAQTYTFDSFGKQTASSGSLTNPFQYTGREFDSETGIYFYRSRYFDPQTGRFLSEDPTGFLGGINLYAYVDNNATNVVDAFGLQGGGPWHPPAGVHTKCTEDDSCPVIKGKTWILQRMIASHTGWDRMMSRPRGGNKHSQDIADLWKQLAECQALAAEKCKDCDKQPNWKPVPIPVVGPILDAITDPILDALQGAWNDLKHWNPPSSRPIWGPVPVPVPFPVTVIP